MGDRYEERNWCAEPHSLRGVFLAALGAEESQIELRFAKPSESRANRSLFS